MSNSNRKPLPPSKAASSSAKTAARPPRADRQDSHGSDHDNTDEDGANIPVESGVPMPEAKAGRRYPFKNMAVGDSFAYPGTAQAASQTVNYQNKAAKEAGSGRRYAARTMPDKSIRIWRTA